MKSLFGPFSAVHHNVTSIRLLAPVSSDIGAARDAQWVMLETETSFTMKGDVTNELILIPRLLMFLVGESEVPTQGTDRMQILEAKVWWDSGELERRRRARKESAARQLRATLRITTCLTCRTHEFFLILIFFAFSFQVEIL